MGSFFVNPGILWLSPLVAVPIIIYLINRHRFRRRRWAAMEFLLRAVKKSQRRLQIQNLLLLIVRCLIVLLLVLAASRPILEESPLLSSGGGKNWVLVLDTSFSMDYRDGPRSLLDRARETMLRTVEDMVEDDDRVAVMTMGYQPRVLLDPGEKKEELEFSLRQLTIDHRPVRLVTSLRSLDDLLGRFSSATGKRDACEVVLFTDLQRRDWLGEAGPRSPEIRQILERLQSDGSQLIIADLSQEDDKLNVAVTELSVRPELVSRGVPIEVRVTVRNFSKRDAENLDLSLRIDPDIDAADTEAQLGEVIRVPAGSSVTRALPLRFDEGGYHSIVAEVRSDGLVIDNERFLVVRVHDEIEVLLVDGEPAVEPTDRETFFLDVALAPRDDGLGAIGGRVTPFQPIERSAELLANTDWKRYAVVVLANVDELPETELRTLERYVREGGALLVFLGGNTQAETYNAVFHRNGEGLLPFPLVGRRGDARAPVYIRFSDPAHPVTTYFDEHRETLELHKALVPFYYFVRAKEPVLIGSKQVSSKDGVSGSDVTQSAAQKAASLTRVFARFNDLDASPALFDNPYGRGRVLWVMSTADDDWNELPAWRDFVVLVHEAVAYLVGFRGRTDNLGIGEEFQRFYESAEFVSDVILHAPPLPGASLGSRRTIRLPMKTMEDDSRFEVGYEGSDDHDGIEVPGLYRLDFSADFRSRSTSRSSPTSDEEETDRSEGNDGESSESRDGTVEYFAVNVDTSEGDLTPISVSEFETHFGFEPTMRDLSADISARRELAERLRGYEFWPWCLGLVVALLFFETALAQWFGRRVG